MLIYHDDTKRYIELYVTKSEARLELQDLNPEFEYEMSYKVTDMDALCTALDSTKEDLAAKLIETLKGKSNAMTVFVDILNENNICFDGFSRMG